MPCIVWDWKTRDFVPPDVSPDGKRQRAPDGLTFLYLMERAGQTKIGVSGDPEHRRASLQSGAPGRLEIVDAILIPRSRAYRIEAMAHRALDWASAGGEWFDLDQDEIGVPFELAAAEEWGRLDGLVAAMRESRAQLQRLQYATRTEREPESVAAAAHRAAHHAAVQLGMPPSLERF